ncbi:hypothetical protein HYZ99_03745 [Candidatus Peregrinibacteria bacterium]|nr:hypothetical protein [Candidatus Peregrinibacteria bacterium]
MPGHKAYPVLGACESSEDAFPPGRYLMIKDPINRLSQDYHSTVSSIVEAHLKPRTIRCTEDVREVPSGELSALAAKLPPWKDSEDRTGLRETDIGVVLLEYLRVYECALNEQRFFLPSRVAQDVQKDSVVGIFDHLTTFGDRLKRIKQELFLARMTLDRTLTYLGGMDRLRPVDASLECLQRSSLDIRNILGLTADVSACLPRAWDARTSLRDPPNSSSGSQ